MCFLVRIKPPSGLFFNNVTCKRVIWSLNLVLGWVHWSNDGYCIFVSFITAENQVNIGLFRAKIYVMVCWLRPTYNRLVIIYIYIWFIFQIEWKVFLLLSYEIFIYLIISAGIVLCMMINCHKSLISPTYELTRAVEA